MVLLDCGLNGLISLSNIHLVTLKGYTVTNEQSVLYNIPEE